MHDESINPPADGASPGPSPDDDEARPSDEFRQALADYEGDRPAAPGATAEPAAGSRVQARIVSISDKEALVDFGGRSEGVVETQFLRDEFGALRHEVGDVIDLVVVQAEDQVILAPSLRADPRAALRQLRDSHGAGTPVTGKVTALNAGGLEVDLGGVHGFCPLSQIELGFCSAPSAYIGRSVEFLVTEMDETRNRAVLSRKALLRREEDEKAQRLLATLQPGAELMGKVRRLEPFGAFVDLGGIDGLVHVSEIRHERTGHPREVLTEGQQVQVRVLRIEKDKEGRPRIGLSIKAAAPDPWTEIGQRFAKGMRVQGTVARLTNFGAFVNLAPGIDGLVHVSEAALQPVAHVKEVLQPNQTIEVVVLGVDPAKKRISLSVREALAASGAASPDEAGGGEAAAGPVAGGAPAAEGVRPPRPRPAREAATRMPAVGDVLEGIVAGIKPYGMFVDLPSLGHRMRGLVPREETGEPRDSDLARKFKIGNRLSVAVIEVKEGKIRLSLAGARDHEERASFKAYQERQRPKEAPLTTMGEALRKAMEKAKEKERQKEQPGG
jgi:ribosomal protein S1